MTRVSWAVVAVLVVALAAVSVLYAQVRMEQSSAQGADVGGVQMAQAPAGGFGGRGDLSQVERARMREQMLERVLEEAGLSDKEKAAAKRAIEAKDKARQPLADELTKLQRTANKAKLTDKELRDALAAYRAAAAEYRKRVAAQDQALVKQLSLKAQARCMSLGILDNGLGGMRFMGRGTRGRGGETRRRG